MAESFKDHFSGVAGNYAAFRPDYPRELFQWLAGISPARDAVWDCATGNGQAALGLAEFFSTVFATDASKDQIASATSHTKIRYSVAPAENSGLSPQSVDLVTVAQSAHWFRLDKFYSEVKRVLRPGGCVALWCYGVIKFDAPDVQRLTDDFYENVVGLYWPPERRLVEEGYRTIAFPFTELEPATFEMRAEFTLERFLGYLRTWSATQRFIKAKGFDPVDKLALDLTKYWSSPGPRIHWPISLRSGRV